MKEINFSTTTDELNNFLKIIKELNKVEQTHKILFMGNNVLLYTMIKEEHSDKINSLKIFSKKIDDIFINFPKENKLSMTITDGKKFYDKFTYLADTDNEINIQISFNNSNSIYSFTGNNDILEVRAVCGDDNRLKTLTSDILKEKLNPEYSEYKFNITNEQLSKILKYSKLEDSKGLLTLKIESEEIIISETEWELKLGKLEGCKNTSCQFKKEYLKYIINSEDKNEFVFAVFPSYIVIDETKSYLMFCVDLID